MGCLWPDALLLQIWTHVRVLLLCIELKSSRIREGHGNGKGSEEDLFLFSCDCCVVRSCVKPNEATIKEKKGESAVKVTVAAV